MKMINLIYSSYFTEDEFEENELTGFFRNLFGHREAKFIKTNCLKADVQNSNNINDVIRKKFAIYFYLFRLVVVLFYSHFLAFRSNLFERDLGYKLMEYTYLIFRNSEINFFN